MEFLRKFLGTDKKSQIDNSRRKEADRLYRELGLADPNHTARVWIDKASQLADQAFEVHAAGISVEPFAAADLVRDIDEALQKSPHDLDLLVAKSGALCCATEFKTGEEILDQVLSINPEHFEARMRKDYWKKWPHLFTYPSWSEKATTLHPLMAKRRQQGHQVQIVRDGLQIGIAVIQRAQGLEPQELSPRTRSKWEPVWSDTPYGAVVAHYLLIEVVPGAKPWRREGFLSTFVPDGVTPTSGYWLLQRMNNTASCFLVLAQDSRVLHNKRYVFPGKLRSTLLSISQQAVQIATREDPKALQNACQWHMQNFDMERVHFK